jgi:hypothetical protein
MKIPAPSLMETPTATSTVIVCSVAVIKKNLYCFSKNFFLLQIMSAILLALQNNNIITILI